MKRFTFLFAMLLTMTAWTFAQNGAKISFKETAHDFGTFSEDQNKVTCEFVFTNSGKEPLIITRAVASCGCTTPTYPKEPIAPNGTGKISVTYNAKGRPGAFQKNIYIYANTEPEKTTLTIKGNVTPSAQ